MNVPKHKLREILVDALDNKKDWRPRARIILNKPLRCNGHPFRPWDRDLYLERHNVYARWKKIKDEGGFRRFEFLCCFVRAMKDQKIYSEKSGTQDVATRINRRFYKRLTDEIRESGNKLKF